MTLARFSLFLGLLLPLFAIGQNLVPNGDFEIFSPYHNACGSWANYTTGFGSCPHARLHCELDSWFEPGGGSTDIYTRCECSATGNGIFRCEGQNPLFDLGGPRLRAENGNACIWLRYYGIVDYATVPLNEPLLPGGVYNVQFDLLLGPGQRYGTNAFGLLFTENAPSWSWWATPNFATHVPQLPTAPINLTVENTWFTFTEQWTVPDGQPLRFLTIGNWRPFASGRIDVEPSRTTRAHADVFVDNIRIEEVPLGFREAQAHPITDSSFAAAATKIHLYPQPVGTGQPVFVSNALADTLLSIQVYSIAGQLVSEAVGATQLLAPTQAGVYLLKIRFQSSGVLHRRLVVVE
jgi:hypothetical protein